MRLAESTHVRNVTVAVVDPRPGDYAGLLEEVRTSPLRAKWLYCGRDALRLSPFPALWIVNVTLPDMSGLDLCAMLRTQSPSPTVYMLTDKYRPADERAAWLAGASLFSPKPALAARLDRWCSLAEQRDAVSGNTDWEDYQDHHHEQPSLGGGAVWRTARPSSRAEANGRPRMKVI